MDKSAASLKMSPITSAMVFELSTSKVFRVRSCVRTRKSRFAFLYSKVPFDKDDCKYEDLSNHPMNHLILQDNHTSVISHQALNAEELW